jgi:DNA-binding winged helix-turn-helix (wHTH) protein/Tol biopolymer transport system component
MGLGGDGRLRFGDYELDCRAGKLWRDGFTVKIQPQPMRVLRILLEQPGEIVSREQLRERVWGVATFVEFDQGLNYCIRQVRVALRDGASRPVYIETLPKQGYRFIAPVSGVAAQEDEPSSQEPAAVADPADPRTRSQTLILAIAFGVILMIASAAIYASLRSRPGEVRYTQITDFIDSATSPSLSADGRMVAFIRGNRGFLTGDQVWVKMLPGGASKRLTDDPRLKYNVAFSPDGSEVAYTVLESPGWATYTVPVLGGDAHRFLENAAGLTWLDPGRLLFSAVRSGQHMGIVTGTAAREDRRELYFPMHERAMAHYSYASPDRKSALVVEMNERGAWAPCELISLNGLPSSKEVGPEGACTSAGWSPDGGWMYFTAHAAGKSHLWRQRFPSGRPEQITFGPTEEKGVAVEPDGRSIITSLGVHESSIWVHDDRGERSLSSEGEVVTDTSYPSFSVNGKILYYLLRHPAAGSSAELWRVNVDSGVNEPVRPGIAMLSYDISPDGKRLVYATEARGGKSQLWLARIGGESPATRIGDSGEMSPHFGPRGEILFQFTEGKLNYLEQMNQDGSGRSKVFPFPVNQIRSVSPGRKWVMAIALRPDGNGVGDMAIPIEGGPAVLLCTTICNPSWAPDGKLLFIPVEEQSLAGPGSSLAIPVGPGEVLPAFPKGGIKPLSDPTVIPGSQTVERAELVPGIDIAHFAFVNTTVHRNLYKISLP